MSFALLNFVFICYAQEVSNDIRILLSSEGKVLYGDEPNSIVVIDYPENIQRIADYLDVIDVSPQQVLIEARLVEVKLQKEHALGVNWKAFADKGYMTLGRFKLGSSALGQQPGLLEQTIPYKNTNYPPGQATTGQESPFTLAIFDDNINVVVQTLANSLDTNLLSAPRVTTVNNREAEIKVTQSLPWAEPEVSVSGQSGSVTVTWKVNFEEVGITLKATPTINNDGKISMVLNPEISEKTGDYTLTVVQGSTSIPYTIPIIDTRSASTKVVIGNGQTLIIGGLIKEKNTKGVTKVPFLGDIPLLGYLFKSKKEVGDKTELLIFVSPTIITDNEFKRMAKDEKYRIGKDYMKEREEQVRSVMRGEREEKEKKDKLSAQLESLNKKQDSLVKERKKIEAMVVSEEKNLKTLKDAQKILAEEKKGLEK